MFTGIITDLGKLIKKEHGLFTFRADTAICRKIEIGTSVAVNGVCLTVCVRAKQTFAVDLMRETIKKTTFGTLPLNSLVNLELPVTLQTFFSGHIVQGHVDGTGMIKQIKKQGTSRILTIEIAKNLSKYIVEKGSIALNGISLTVIESAAAYFSVGIIPYTWEHTMLGKMTNNEPVNIETDILAKYLEKFLSKENEK